LSYAQRTVVIVVIIVVVVVIVVVVIVVVVVVVLLLLLDLGWLGLKLSLVVVVLCKRAHLVELCAGV
jgi:hypothetical protein